MSFWSDPVGSTTDTLNKAGDTFASATGTGGGGWLSNTGAALGIKPGDVTMQNTIGTVTNPIAAAGNAISRSTGGSGNVLNDVGIGGFVGNMANPTYSGIGDAALGAGLVAGGAELGMGSAPVDQGVGAGGAGGMNGGAASVPWGSDISAVNLSGAGGAGGAGAGGAAGGGMSLKNEIGLGLAGLGLAKSFDSQSAPNPDPYGTGAAASQTANALYAKYNNGQLSPTDQASIAQAGRQQTEAIKASYAAQGLSGSSMEAQALSSVSLNQQQMTQQVLANMLTQANSAAGVSSQYAQQITQMQISQNAQLQQQQGLFMNTMTQYLLK